MRTRRAHAGTGALEQGRVPVVHSMHVWLSQTMTWLHMQVRSLPEHMESHVVCDVTANLDQFPIDRLVSGDRDPALWRMAKAKSWRIARRRHAHLLRRTVARSGARILHSHFGDRAWSNIDTAASAGARHVVTYYGYDVSRLPHESPEWKDRYARLFATADLFLCEGPHLGRALEALGCPAAKIVTHHLGIDLERTRYRPREWRRGEPLKVLIAGSFVEKKGIPYAIRALGRLRSKVDIEIDIVGDAIGQSRSIAEKSRIEAAVDEAGLRPRTRLLGYRPHAELLEIAYRNHVFVSPSVTAADGDTEGGAPVSIIEMAATGMPVVSTTHCDIPEVLKGEAARLLADERDVDGLEARLCWLVEHPDEWTTILGAARRHIELEFDGAAQGQRLALHYQSVLVQ